MIRNLPLWPLILLAAGQLWAWVHFTVTDSPWRLVGVGIAILLMLLCMFGYLGKK